MDYSRIQETDPEIYDALIAETEREQEKILLIASENYASEAVMQATGSVFTNKYAEGYPGRRYYGGCEFVDRAEELAIQRAKEIFGAEHVNVQPHSGTQANMAVYLAALEPGDTVLGMNLAHGGHLSHGSKANFSGKIYRAVSYGVERDTGLIDFDNVARIAREEKPKLIICGYSAYSRIIDFPAFARIAKDVGAYLLADIAHIAGLVAAGVHPSPFPHADFVTTTTHKTLRGPRGGMTMCREEFAKKVDKVIFPGIQGGPLMNVIAAKAVAFKEAQTEAFKDYQRQIVKNAKALAAAMMGRGYKIVSGGTDNHLMLVDLRTKGLTGKAADEALDRAGITLNKNGIPYDEQPATVTSGIRMGTPSVTTRGMKEPEMDRIAELIDRVLSHIDDGNTIAAVRDDSRKLCRKFPIY